MVKLDSDFLKNKLNLTHFKYLKEFRLESCVKEPSNVIDEIDSNIFQNLENLEILDLSHNKIKQFDSPIFANLKKLKELRINSNQIEKIDSNLFQNLENLEILDLSDNKIIQLDSAVFANLKKLKELRVDSNKINLERNSSFLSLVFGNKFAPYGLDGIYRIQRNSQGRPCQLIEKTTFENSFIKCMLLMRKKDYELHLVKRISSVSGSPLIDEEK